MSVARRFRILRIRRDANLLTAQAYEALFDRELGRTFDVSTAPLESWCDAVLGPVGTPLDLPDAARRFRRLVAGQDFFCPNYECIPLAATLLAVRNAARARIRLLFIAHAAGSYSFEWAVMWPLLRTGDLIIAPSESARRTIEHLCPPLAPFVRAIPHPMAPLVAVPRRDGRRAPAHVVSLGRVHAEKLIHRQIEAMAMLRARTRREVHMTIGGPLNDGGWEGPHPYTRTLQEKVRRLNLGEHVSFAGAIRGDRAKSAFFAGASALVNLSVTIEESFPKTPIEALGVGIPVVGTDWNGLRDTVGECGRLVPVTPSGSLAGGVDVDAAVVADALASILESPPSAEQCMDWTKQFAPSVILPRYRAAVEEALGASEHPGALADWPAASLGAAPPGGLLADAAPLDVLSWRELFAAHLSWCDAVRGSWSGIVPPPQDDGLRIRGVLLCAVERPLKYFFAQLPTLAVTRGVAPMPVVAPDRSVPGLFARSALKGGLTSGRVACLFELMTAGRLPAASALIDALERDGLPAARVLSCRAELALAAGDAPAALAFALACTDAHPLVEGDWPLVRQLARVARRATRPDAALPAVLAWLDQFPDAQESGPVWLDACINTTRSGGSPEAARHYHARARALLGDSPTVMKCGALVARLGAGWAQVA
jgi:glycosyltransferase involved in cell wall biosynthesis